MLVTRITGENSIEVCDTPLDECNAVDRQYETATLQVRQPGDGVAYRCGSSCIPLCMRVTPQSRNPRPLQELRSGDDFRASSSSTIEAAENNSGPTTPPACEETSNSR